MYSNGDLYKNNKFEKMYDIAIDYKYYNTHTNLKYGLLYKFKFAKNKDNFVKMNMKYDETLTEREIMELNGYSRYYDAGKIKWQYK